MTTLEITEPNYTQVPNTVLDNMHLMTDTELRCTLALVRKIIGWHKDKPEPVSYSQLMDITGLSRQGVRNGIRAALKRGTVKIGGKGPRGINLYTLKFVTNDHRLVNVVDQSTELTTTSQRSRPEPVNVVDTQKKLKESKDKDSAQPKPEAPQPDPIGTSSDVQSGEDDHDPVKEDARGESTEKATPKPKRERSARQLQLDAMKNAIALAFGLDVDKVTETQWSEFGKAGKDLIKVGATPDEMPALYHWCIQQGWRGTFTSIAMAKNYANFVKSQRPTLPHSSTATSAANPRALALEVVRHDG